MAGEQGKRNRELSINRGIQHRVQADTEKVGPNLCVLQNSVLTNWPVGERAGFMAPLHDSAIVSATPTPAASRRSVRMRMATPALGQPFAARLAARLAPRVGQGLGRRHDTLLHPLRCKSKPASAVRELK